MKKLLFAFALTGLAFSCKSTADVADTSVGVENAVESECCATECSDMGAEACTGEKAMECTGEKAMECTDEKKVCPVTGAVE